MREILNQIATLLERDWFDYLSVIVPTMISIVALFISFWNTYYLPKIKKAEGTLVWDDMQSRFFIIIRNTGNKTLIIESISLFSAKNKRGKKETLGTRENLWSSDGMKYIKANEMIIYSPAYGSIYDIFGYKGHAFDVTDENKNKKIFLKIVDIDGKTWICKTKFKSGEIDDNIMQVYEDLTSNQNIDEREVD